MAAIRAMGEQGRNGSAFVAILEKQAADPSANDLMGEAIQALKKIRGGG